VENGLEFKGIEDALDLELSLDGRGFAVKKTF